MGRKASPWLPVLLVVCLITGVATANDEAQSSEADPEVLTVGPNVVPNFRSAHYLVPPLIEPGLDFTRVPLTSTQRDAFPNGRQFVFVRTLTPGPPGGVDQAVQGLDLDRYRRLLDDGADHFHVVFTKATPEARDLELSEMDYTIEELWGASDTRPLEGPWTIWVDDRNVLTRMTYLYRDYGDTAVATRSPPHYVCVDDGRALGSVGNYWPRHDDARLRELYDACLDGTWGSEWSPIQFGSRDLIPPFSLVDGNGNELPSEELTGAPYAIVALAPVSQPSIEFLPGRDPPMYRAIEPEPAVRFEQVRTVFAEAVPDMRIIVLAMPHNDGEWLWSTDEVADALSEQLDAPVYRDTSRQLVNALAQYLGPPTSLVVVDAQGRLVDTFSDWMLGEAAYEWIRPPSMEDVLRRTIGWGSE